MGFFSTKCNYNKWDPRYIEVSNAVKQVLGSKFNAAIFQTITGNYVSQGNDIKSITKDYVLEQWPQESVPQEKISNKGTEEKPSVETPLIQNYDGYWTRAEVAKPENQDKLFIFTDNTDRNSGYGLISDNSKYATKYGKGKHYPQKSTSAVIRGLDNAFPISTQRYYHLNATREKGRWTNADVEEFKQVIHDEIDTIIQEWQTGNYTSIILPDGGLFTESEITDLHGKDRTEIKAALEEEVKRLYEVVGVPYSSEVAKYHKPEVVRKEESKKEARKVARDAKVNSEKWARNADGKESIEVSSAGDEFGRQFSALDAVLAEGTTIRIRIGGKREGKEQIFDVGGYSIEAAYQLIKGYEGNPKGSLLGKSIKIKGKGSMPTQHSILRLQNMKHDAQSVKAAQDFSYQYAYKPLWDLWAKQNKEKIAELKNKCKKTSPILTDRFASTRVSQARALAEIVYGKPKEVVSEYVQEGYDIQRKNAISASRTIMAVVKKMRGHQDGIKLVVRKDNNDQQIAYMAQAKNSKGQQTDAKAPLLSFNLSNDLMSKEISLHINPFEGQKDAVKKFIQWIIPNDFDSLPKELRVNMEQRNTLRTYMSKGGWQGRDILTDGSEENAIYAKTLRYIIDNFQELRERYNPVSIQEFANLYHKVTVTADTVVREAGENVVTRFTPLELSKTEGVDDSNSIRVEMVVDTDNNVSDNYIVNFPVGKKFTRAQKDRLFKSVAKFIPEGSTVTINADGVVDDTTINDFNKIVERGFTKVGDTAVTKENGNTAYVGVFKRNGFKKESVLIQDSYTLNELRENHKPNHIYILETSEEYIDKKMWQSDGDFVLPLETRHYIELREGTYWRDEAFDAFKRMVDETIDIAKEDIDNGYVIVLPKGTIGTGSSALQHYAPKCFEYLQGRIEELKDYGNREAYTNLYLRSRTATVDAISSSPSEGLNLRTEVLQGARARLRQRFTDDEIQDLARYYCRDFLRELRKQQKNLIKNLQQEIAETKDEKKLNKLTYKLNRLNDPDTYQLQVIREVGIDKILDGMYASFQKIGDAKFPDPQHRQTVEDSFEKGQNGEKGFRDLIFEYAYPFIEEASHTRITNKNKVEMSETQTAENDKVEDTEGEDTPEMGFTYNHRLVDPYKSLSREVRRIISKVPMRDISGPRNDDGSVGYVRDSIGQIKYWDSQYIYSCIMSRMAAMSLGEIDNFVTMIPREKLSEEDASMYVYGKPYFPVLEGMKSRYSWANDLITALEKQYSIASLKESHRGMLNDDLRKDPIALSTLGNVVSQFYSNFQQQYVPYCTMVNGAIILENQATGSDSLREATITNYNGNVRFEGIDMIYNHDGSANSDNVVKNIEKVRKISDAFVRKTGQKVADHPLWSSIDKLKKDYSSLFEAYDAAPRDLKDTLKEITDVLKACGMVFSDYDIFGIIMENKDPGIMTMLSELENALNAVKGLPENEHIFESSMVLDNEEINKSHKKLHTPRFCWNKFFEKFGDYVTEREYESSTRIMGKSRYSYTFPSYMSMTLSQLTNPKDEVRKKYIEENFMKYDWFYDKATGTFKNQLLEWAYKGTKTGERLDFDKGHDLICKKDGYKEKDYQDWTPDDIYQLMFRELTQPTNKTSGCFVIPVLSDSRICKVIQAPTVGIPQAREMMAQVVRQELERMKLVEKRNIIFRMQDMEEKISLGQILSDAEQSYYNDNKEFYDTYKVSHPEMLQEVENFDKNGSKFCFFPELNDYNLSISIAARSQDAFMDKVIRLLSNNPNSPKDVEVSLKKVIERLQARTDEFFDERAAALGLTKTKGENYTGEDGKRHFREVQVTMTKEECIDTLINNALDSIMKDKIDDFITPYSHGGRKIDPSVLNGILANNPELAERYYKFNREETADSPLTDEERKNKKQVLDEVYKKAADFYWMHTANMAQFIQLMVTDIAYYKDPTTFNGSIDFAKRWKEVYGAGMKLNTNSKFGKKIERSIILADSVRRSSSFDVIKGVLGKAVSDGRIVDVEADAVLDKFKFIKGTDAQAFRSLTSFRDIMDMIGQSTDDLARAIHNLRTNNWTMNDFYTVLNTVKPFSFGPEDQDSGIDDTRMRTMVQHKNSEAVLLAIYNTLVGSWEGDANYSPKLKGINRAMEEILLTDNNGNVMKYANGEEMKAIDVAQYHSAVKVGAHGIIDINYSRDKLRAAQETGEMKIGDKSFKIGKNESYYKIADRLGKNLDAGAITFEQYEEAMDYFEPTADEVFEIIRSSIYKNGDESLGFDDQVLHKLPYANYSIQQPTPDHYTDNEEATFGSQPRHIIMTDLPDDFKIEIKGKKYNREQLRDRYNSLIVANLIECFENDIEPLFKDTNDKRPAIFRLQERLFDIIDGNPKYGKQMKDALQIVGNAKDGYSFALPLNNIMIAQQLEEIMTSMFKNAIHRQEINGGNVILAADIGYSNKLKVVGGKRDADGKLISAEGIEGIECFLPAHMRRMFEPYMKKGVRQIKDDDGNVIKEIEYQYLDPKELKKSGLDKAIGYRIPTEGLYSIMPLIIKGFLPQQSGSSIVVAQEITTLTGSDNDVDKLFLMLKSDKDLKAITSEADAHPLEMSKAQRDNEIIDIFYGVLTHPKMSHRWIHPGHYDNVRLNAKRLRILKDRRIRKQFMLKANINTTDELLDKLTKKQSQSELNTLYRKVMDIPASEEVKDKSIDDIVVDFAGKYIKVLSPCYPDTFVKMHQTYMAGVAEKGIFANNNTDHAKLQWADVQVAPHATFVFEGREVRKIDERYIEKTIGSRKYLHYISDDCAECSAASVDNGKDPQLDDINCTQKTATLFGFLLRLGLGIEGASLLFAQPSIDYSIRSEGSIDRKILKKEIRNLAARLKKLNRDPQDDRFNWRIHNFSTRELYENICIENYNQLMNGGGGDYEIERIGSLYRTYNLMLNIMDMNEEMQNPRTVLHYDSPKHAASTSMGGVVMQTKAVEALNDRENRLSFDRMLSGYDQLIVYDLEGKSKGKQENKKKYESLKEAGKKISSKYRMYDMLMQSQLPITQAFYTLGIEKVRKEFAPQFAFGRPEIQDLTDRLCKLMDSRRIMNEEDRADIAGHMYRDWVVYNLSKTKMFGDDGEMTFDQKRQYYLYEYPAKFLELKATMPELNKIDAIRRMGVNKGRIVMDRSGKTTVTLRDFITDSFDTLLQHKDPDVQKVAKDLFLYTYYLNGFEFSYMSFGNMLGTEFQRAFPEYIQSLRNMNTDTITDDDLDNFFEQFQLKRGTLGLIRHIEFINTTKKAQGLQKGFYDTGKKPEEYGGIDEVDEYVIKTSVVGNSLSSEILKLNRNLTELYGTIIYEPLPMNTSLHFNANQTVDEMTEVIYDQDIINANSKIGRKKRGKDSIVYDSYQANKNLKDTDAVRDANSPEPSPEPERALKSLGVDNDGDEVSDRNMDAAVGSVSFKDDNDVPADYDTYISSSATARNAIAAEEGVDKDIEEAQSKLMQDNNGRGLCIE